MGQIIRNRLMYLYPITIFHIIRFFIGYTIQIYDSVLDFQCLTRQTYTAFHIVFTAVYRTADYFAKHLLVLVDILTTYFIIMVKHHALLHSIHSTHIHRLGQFLTSLITQAINVFSRNIHSYCISGREIEYYDVIELYLTKTFHTLIVPCRPFQIRLGIDYRQRMLSQWHVKRCLRHTRAITSLADEQIIAHQQRLLQR